MKEFSIEQSVIWSDIKDVIYSKKKPIKYEYRAMLHTEKQDTPIFKITSIDIVRDYIDKVGDHINIEFMMPLGDYIFKLYPYRNNLELTLKSIELQELSNVKEKNSNITTEKYKAIFLPNENDVQNTSRYATYNIESLNKADIIKVKLQLLDRSLEALRIKTTQGIFNKITQKQLLSSIMISESNKILIDGKPSVEGLNLVNPDNEDTKNNIIIPSGTHLFNIPTYLHSKMGGVYNSGIGVFIQTYNKIKSWFIYPLFNINRFNEDVEKVIFISLSNGKYKDLERTYNKNGKILTVVASSEHNYFDSADTDYMNNGSGYRLTDARAFMKKPVKIGQNGPQGVRNSLNHEVVTEERNDGLNYAPVSKRGISSNPFIDRSMLSMRNIARIDLIWENANSGLLYPGMPCKFIFLNKNKPVELKGTVAATHTYINLVGDTVNSSVYKNKCGITIFVDKYKLQPEDNTSISPGDF